MDKSRETEKTTPTFRLSQPDIEPLSKFEVL